MISHDRDFIDAICDRTLSGRPTVVAYQGGYSAFEKQRAGAWHSNVPSTRVSKRSLTSKTMRQFRAKATKAKQAQSRLKALSAWRRLHPRRLTVLFSISRAR